MGPATWAHSSPKSFWGHDRITLTEQALVFHRASRASNRPQELVLAVPRDQVPALVSNAARSSLWSYFHFHFPGEPKPTRINVGRQWRAELDQFMPMITAPAQH